MPIELFYDASIDAIVIKATGRVGYHDLPLLAKELLEHEKFRTNINQLFDCTKGELDISTEELKQVANEFNEISHVLGLKRKLALAVSRTVDFGMVRMYEVLFQPGPDVEVHSFRSLSEAREWLAPE